ncbi:MAG: class I SAM-dependent methyltransferase [Planctomycetota bacterium]
MSETPDYLAPYTDAVAKVGPRFEALLWRNRDFQLTRFDVLESMCEMTGRVVADMGCGTGDLAHRLHASGVEYGAYVGVEGVPELVTESRKRADEADLPEVSFVESDFVTDAELPARLVREHRVDTILFSGSLNTLGADAAGRALAQAWSGIATERNAILAFNFLSASGGSPGEHTGPAVRLDPHALLRFALSRTPLVAFRQDYLGAHDATIVMRTPAE